MAQQDNLMAQNRSMLKDFIGSIATMTGDLSNITAPPFVLDTKSTVELPQYWADHPSIFCAPSKSSDPAERAMLVLRWYLSSLRNQNYMGRSEGEGVKKPLNAFLGELFLGRFEEDSEGVGETRLVGEQVSHHPPITACRVWNDTHGVIASGYTRQTITFSGNVTIQQTGHALLTLTKHDDESYLIPLPTLKVRGILSGAPYPELGGKYYITSTSGYTSVIEFSGRSWFGGSSKKNSLEAKVFSEQDGGQSNPLYTIKGQWNGEFVIHDARQGKDIENFDVTKQAATAAKLTVDPIDEQDPWETRRAWKDVIGSLNRGDMAGTSKAKNIVEQGQRNMRKDDQREGRQWQPVFFRSIQDLDILETLEEKIPGNNGRATADNEKKETLGIWVFEEDKWHNGEIQRPFHDGLVPDNSQSTHRYSVDESSASSRRNSTFFENTSRRASRSSVESIYSHTSSRRSSERSNGSAAASPSPSRASAQTKSNTLTNTTTATRDRRRSGVSDLSPLRNSLENDVETSSTNSNAKLIAKDQPDPQVEQAFQAENARNGSGVPGMSLHEKQNVEDFLRTQYATSK